MHKKWAIKDLDLSKAREYISSADPNISLRYVLPIPNWLSDDKPIFEDENIVQIQKKTGPEWRFVFTNHKDTAKQGVKIDGSAAIVFMGADEDTALKLNALIDECMAGHEQMSPEILSLILERSYKELGMKDRFNKGLKSIKQYFNPHMVKGELAGYVPKPNPSAAVYIDGKGEFLEGPTLTPQKFENGAFITFPGVRVTELFNEQSTLKGRLVQAEVFIRDRTELNGSKINIELVPSQ